VARIIPLKWKSVKRKFKNFFYAFNRLSKSLAEQRRRAALEPAAGLLIRVRQLQDSEVSLVLADDL
jgi:hypothetical protein